MKHPKHHIHDWQWSEDYGYYLCACGETLQPEESHRVEPVEQRHPEPIERPRIAPDPPRLEEHLCWSCLGSGYSDYAIGQPCEVCGGWGYWESI